MALIYLVEDDDGIGEIESFALKNAGHEIVLVSSGAIGMGVGKLSLGARPADMPTKQAAAAVGQMVFIS